VHSVYHTENTLGVKVGRHPERLRCFTTFN
jgi:hypothetical protein